MVAASAPAKALTVGDWIDATVLMKPPPEEMQAYASGAFRALIWVERARRATGETDRLCVRDIAHAERLLNEGLLLGKLNTWIWLRFSEIRPDAVAGFRAADLAVMVNAVASVEARCD